MDKNQDNIPDENLADDEISLLDILIVLAEGKKFLIGFTLGAGILAAAYSMTLPIVYTANTKILPPQQQSSASAMLAQQLGSLAGLAGGVAGIKNPSDVYIGILKSRSVADKLIDRFKLNERYEQKYQSGTRTALAGATVISAGKDGIINIGVDDEDPKVAAEIANAYIDELSKLTQVLAITEASQRRLFFERQLSDARDKLAKAEYAARQGMERSGLIGIDSQSKAMAEATARLRGQISVKEVQINAMRTFAAEGNPDLKMALQELQALKAEQARLEGATGGAANPKENPKGLANLALLRDVKYHETIYELLARQFELAKIDEAKDAAIIQVLDEAIAPDHRSKPRRTIIVLLTTLAAGFISIIWLFIRSSYQNAKRSPETSGRIERLGRLIRGQS